MKKSSKTKFNITKIAGSVVGGAAAQFAGSFIPIGGDTIKGGIMAVGGAALGAFVKGDITEGIGNGMMGAGGYLLAASFNKPAAAKGIGLLPGQSAVAALSNDWIAKRDISGIGAGDPSNPIPSGAKSIM